MSRDKFEITLSSTVLNLCQAEYAQQCHMIEVDAIISVTQVKQQGKVDHVYKIHETLSNGEKLGLKPRQTLPLVQQPLLVGQDVPSRKRPEGDGDEGSTALGRARTHMGSNIPSASRGGMYPSLSQSLSADGILLGPVENSDGHWRDHQTKGQDILAAGAHLKGHNPVAKLLSQLRIPAQNLRSPLLAEALRERSEMQEHRSMQGARRSENANSGNVNGGEQSSVGRQKEQSSCIEALLVKGASRKQGEVQDCDGEDDSCAYVQKTASLPCEDDVDDSAARSLQVSRESDRISDQDAGSCGSRDLNVSPSVNMYTDGTQGNRAMEVKSRNFNVSKGNRSPSNLSSHDDKSPTRDKPMLVLEVKEEPCWEEEDCNTPHTGVVDETHMTQAGRFKASRMTQAGMLQDSCMTQAGMLQETHMTQAGMVDGNKDSASYSDPSQFEPSSTALPNLCIKSEKDDDKSYNLASHVGLPKNSEIQDGSSYDSILLQILKSSDSQAVYQPALRHSASDNQCQPNSLINRLPYVKFRELFYNNANHSSESVSEQGVFPSNRIEKKVNSVYHVNPSNSSKHRRNCKRASTHRMNYSVFDSIVEDDDDYDITYHSVDGNDESDSSYLPSDDNTYKNAIKSKRKRKREKNQQTQKKLKLANANKDQGLNLNLRINDNINSGVSAQKPVTGSHNLLRQILSAPKVSEQSFHVLDVPDWMNSDTSSKTGINENSVLSSGSCSRDSDGTCALKVDEVVHLKLFPCSICGSEYSTKEDRDTHQKSEQIKDLMRCPFCSGFFVDVDTRRKHITSHHGDISSTVVPFKPEDGQLTLFSSQCPKCHMVFADGCERDQHLVSGHRIVPVEETSKTNNCRDNCQEQE